MVSLRTWTRSPNILNTGASPFNQDDWPLPGRGPSQGHADLRTWVQTPEILNAGAQPFTQTDWPVPRGPAGVVDLRTLIGIPATFTTVVAAPFAQTDWPNPRGAGALLDLRTWIQTPEILNTGAEPFSQTDWPVPAGARGVVDLRTWLQATPLNLIPAALPFGQDDWPVPRGAVPAISLRTWSDPVKLNLLGQDQFFGAPGQVPPQYDWPVPRGAQPASDLRTWLQGGRLVLSTIIPVPFNQFDWPVPKGAIPASTLRTHIEQVKRLLIGQDQFFGAPGMGPHYDYPNPRGPVPGISLRTWTSSYTLSLIGKDQFYGAPGQGPPQYDWPVPKGPVPGTSLRTHIDPVKLPLGGQDAVYGAPGQVPTYDQPLAPRAASPVSVLRTWTSRTLQLLAPPAPVLPLDWPVPRGAKGAHVAIVQPSNLPLLTTPIVVPPIAQRDWPNPVLPFPQTLRYAWSQFFTVQSQFVYDENLIAFSQGRDFIATAVKRNLVASGAARNRIAVRVRNTSMSQTNTLVPPIDADVEKEFVFFDYSQVLVNGATIASVANVTCEVFSDAGNPDPSPSSRLIGPPAVVPSPRTKIAGTAVAQMIGTMIADNTYFLSCLANITDGQVLQLWTRIECVDPDEGASP
jgi:hypothetical protein